MLDITNTNLRKGGGQQMRITLLEKRGVKQTRSLKILKKGSTSWNLIKSLIISDDLRILINLGTSWKMNILDSLTSWIIIVHLGILIHTPWKQLWDS